jgi:hypothetical protein
LHSARINQYIKTLHQSIYIPRIPAHENCFPDSGIAYSRLWKRPRKPRSTTVTPATFLGLEAPTNGGALGDWVAETVTLAVLGGETVIVPTEVVVIGAADDVTWAGVDEDEDDDEEEEDVACEDEVGSMAAATTPGPVAHLLLERQVEPSGQGSGNGLSAHSLHGGVKYSGQNIRTSVRTAAFADPRIKAVITASARDITVSKSVCTGQTRSFSLWWRENLITTDVQGPEIIVDARPVFSGESAAEKERRKGEDVRTHVEKEEAKSDL